MHDTFIVVSNTLGIKESCRKLYKIMMMLSINVIQINPDVIISVRSRLFMVQS